MRSVAFVLALTLAAASPARAETHSAAGEFGYGLAAILCDILYAPGKVIYAAGGTIIAAPAWLIAGQDRRVFRAISQPALRGDYLITPERLRGERTLHFMGRDPELGPYSDL